MPKSAANTYVQLSARRGGQDSLELARARGPHTREPSLGWATVDGPSTIACVSAGESPRASGLGLLTDAEARIVEDRARRADLRGSAVTRVYSAKLEALAIAGRAETREACRAVVIIT